jgi:hypothetical protein
MRRVVVRGGTNGARATPGGSTRFVVEQPKNFTQIIVKSGTRECQAVQQQYNKYNLLTTSNDTYKNTTKNGNSQFWALFQSLFPFLTHTYTHMSSGGPPVAITCREAAAIRPEARFLYCNYTKPKFCWSRKVDIFRIIQQKKSERNGRF